MELGALMCGMVSCVTLTGFAVGPLRSLLVIARVYTAPVVSSRVPMFTLLLHRHGSDFVSPSEYQHSSQHMPNTQQ